jgi:O-antigen/teichoic acid export membrane protein
VMIMEMLGEGAAGIYTIGHRPLDLLLLLPYTFALAMFPSLQRYKVKDGADDTDFNRMSERALRYLHVLFFPLSAFCVVAAEPMIALLAADPDFGPSANVFRIVIWGLPIQAATTIYNRVLMSNNREKDFITIGFAAMVTNVGLNLLLIPRYGWNGAAATTIFSLFVSYLLHRYYTRRAGASIPTMRGLAGGTIVMTGLWAASVLITGFLPERWQISWLSLPFEYGWLAPIVLSLVIVAVYCLLIYAFRIINRDDVKMLVNILPGR